MPYQIGQKSVDTTHHSLILVRQFIGLENYLTCRFFEVRVFLLLQAVEDRGT
jgi:hypothetical protein